MYVKKTIGINTTELLKHIMMMMYNIYSIFLFTSISIIFKGRQ